jgi:hypothetical protein
MFKKKKEFIIIFINLIKVKILLKKLLKTENIKVKQSLSLKYYSLVLLKT